MRNKIKPILIRLSTALIAFLNLKELLKHYHVDEVSSYIAIVSYSVLIQSFDLGLGLNIRNLKSKEVHSNRIVFADSFSLATLLYCLIFLNLILFLDFSITQSFLLSFNILYPLIFNALINQEKHSEAFLMNFLIQCGVLLSIFLGSKMFYPQLVYLLLSSLVLVVQIFRIYIPKCKFTSFEITRILRTIKASLPLYLISFTTVILYSIDKIILVYDERFQETTVLDILTKTFGVVLIFFTVFNSIQWVDLKKKESKFIDINLNVWIIISVFCILLIPISDIILRILNFRIDFHTYAKNSVFYVIFLLTIMYSTNLSTQLIVIEKITKQLRIFVACAFLKFIAVFFLIHNQILSLQYILVLNIILFLIITTYLSITYNGFINYNNSLQWRKNSQ